MLSLIKTVGGPGSLGFLLLGTAAGLVLMLAWPRYRKAGRVWLMALFTTYLALSTPLVAGTIAGLLPTAVSEPSLPRPLHLLIVVEGDNNLGRVRETERVYATAAPARVLVLGGGNFTRDIVSAGVPAGRVTSDGRGLSTRDQIMSVQLLPPNQLNGNVALIASRLQMPRIEGLTRAAGLTLVLVPSPADVEPPALGLQRLVPGLGALWLSRDAIYEHAALALYRWRGWI